MKAKLNLNGAAIKDFFINNGEKLILIATVLILFSFAYGAITAKPIDANKPQEIKTASAAAEERVRQVKWEDAIKDKPELTPRDYKPPVVAAVKPDPDVDKIEIADLDPRLFNPRIKRADPKILPVMELVGTGIWAIVPYQPEEVPVEAAPANSPPRRRGDETKGGKGGSKAGGKANPRAGFGDEGEGRLPLGGNRAGGRRNPGTKNGEDDTPAKDLAADRSLSGYPVPGARALGAKPVPRYMAVVTGIVPFEEQHKEYKARFEDALGIDPAMAGQGIDQFTPSYVFFRIQRAEVKDARDQVPEEAWVRLAIPDAWKDWQNWFQTSNLNEPPIDPSYSFAAQMQQENEYVKWLEWPLPPIFLKNWGFEVTHPKVPFMKPEVVENFEGDQLVSPLDPNAGNNPAGGPVQWQPRPGAPMMGGNRGGFMGRRGMDEGDMRGGRMGGMMRPGMGRPGGMGGDLSGAPMAPYKLYRYVDLTCERGKRYRYRVQLVLNNPNYMLPAAILEKPESATKQYVDSAWSAPSEMIEIPMDAQVLASSVNTTSGEPEGRVNLLGMSHWKKEEKKKPAAAAAGESDLFGGRGMGMLNNEPTEGYVEVMKDFRIPLGGVAYFTNEKVKKVLDMVVEIEKKEVDGLTFNANGAMLLDMRSDDPLGNSKSKGPTEMLFFDKDGRLIAANSAIDYHTSEDYKDRTWLPEDLNTFGGGMGEFPGGPRGVGGPRGRFGE